MPSWVWQHGRERAWHCHIGLALSWACHVIFLSIAFFCQIRVITTLDYLVLDDFEGPPRVWHYDWIVKRNVYENDL